MTVVCLSVSYHPVEGIHNFCSHRAFEVNQESAEEERETMLTCCVVVLLKRVGVG